MGDDDKRWHEDAAENGWIMPEAPWWKRLPIIRNIRAAYHARRVDRWIMLWTAMGCLPSGYDRWVIYGIARGYERDE